MTMLGSHFFWVYIYAFVYIILYRVYTRDMNGELLIFFSGNSARHDIHVKYSVKGATFEQRRDCSVAIYSCSR